MGACYSVQNAKAEAASAVPAPAPAKDEVLDTATAEVKVEQEEKKVEGVENKKNVNDDKHQSLGSLLNKTEEEKQSANTEKAVESDLKVEVPKTEEKAEAVEKKPEVAPPIADAKEVDIISEQKKQEASN